MGEHGAARGAALDWELGLRWDGAGMGAGMKVEESRDGGWNRGRMGADWCPGGDWEDAGMRSGLSQDGARDGAETGTGTAAG